MNDSKSETYADKEAMTVVVPVYNRAHLIARCLDSLFAQTYRPLKVIVVDNASTDGTSDVVNAWIKSHSEPDFDIRIIGESRQGAAFARQSGLDHVDTDKVMFFDSDDAMRPESVSTVMNTWANSPEIEIIAWPTDYHYSDRTSRSHSISGNLLERHLVHSILRTIGYAVKTETLRGAGGWKGNFRTWDDFELGVRLLLPGPEVAGIKSALADVYPQEESLTGTDYSSKTGTWEQSLDAIESYIRESKRKDTRRLLNIVCYRRAILAADYAKENRLDLAKPLLNQAIKKSPASVRPVIWFAYHYTRLGFRGAFLLVGPLL